MHTVSAIERRSAVRYKLRLPVVFHWNDGAEHTEGGFTRDVAISGALILSGKCPPMGHDVRIEVLLPPPDQLDVELRIECVGKVTRILEEAGRVGFGVQGTFDDDHLARHIPLSQVLREPGKMRLVGRQ
jgi:PilZ domain